MAFSDKRQLRALTEENEQLRQAVNELTLLNELATASAGMHDLNEILQTIVGSSMRAVQAEQGVITLLDSTEGDELRTLIRSNLNSGSSQAFRPDDHLLGWMQIHKSPITINDARTDTRFPLAKWDDQVRSMLSVPLITHSKLIGVLTLFNKLSVEGFRENDQRLLTIIAAQSAQIISNAKLSDERAHVIQLFGQHTSPAIVKQLISADAATEGVSFQAPTDSRIWRRNRVCPQMAHQPNKRSLSIARVWVRHTFGIYLRRPCSSKLV